MFPGTTLARSEQIMVVHCNRNCPVFFKRRHLGQRNVEHFTLPSQHSLLITGNWSRNGCRELSFTPGHYYVRFLVLGFRSDIRIELQAPVLKLCGTH